MSADSPFDGTLIELFREEARGNLQALANGLVGLEADVHHLGRTESLMRAAHSLKGGARVMNLPAAVDVAHVLESCLVEAQAGQFVLSAASVDLLLAGTDLLSQIVDHVGPEFEPWWAANQTRVADWLARMQQLRGESDATPLTTVESPHGTVEVSSPGDEIGFLSSQIPPLEPELLQLYRDETAPSIERLQASLAGEAAIDARTCGDLAEAARSLKGVALLLQIQPAAVLAGQLESGLAAVAQGRLDLRGTARAAFVRSIELLRELSSIVREETPETAVAPWIESARTQLRELQRLLPGNRRTEPAPTSARSEIAAAPKLAASATVAPKPAASTTAVPQNDERVVRVTAQSLSRLMGLAGESLVEVRWLQPFAQSLLRLKRQQDGLVDVLDDLARAMPQEEDNPVVWEFLRSAKSHVADCQSALSDRLQEFADYARRSDDLNSRLYNEVITSRMRPFADGVQGFPRMVRDLARDLGKQVRYEVQGETTPVDRDVLDKLDAPLNHLLRNAVDHGLETPEERTAAGKPEAGQLRLQAAHRAGMLAITVSDDGRGIDLDRLRRKVVERRLTTADMSTRMSEAELLEFLFLPGFSTREEVTEISGRGVGLDVVQSQLHALGGSVRIQTRAGQGTSFHLQLPITLSVIRAVLVEIGGEPFAFPHNRIDRLLRIPRSDLVSLEDRQYFQLDGHSVGALLARQVFRMGGALPPGDLFVVLFSRGQDQFGLIADGFRGEQDLVVRPLDPRLGKVPNVSSAAILDDGSPVLIVDVDDVHRSIERLLAETRLERTDAQAAAVERRRKRILVVDDSLTVREAERHLLSSRGYDVTVAVDGADGWNIVREGNFDLIVSDIDMPRMNGIEFTTRIKSDPELSRVPVVIVSYKDREEDRLRGLEAGADFYLTKSSFHDESFLQTVSDLIGEA